MKKLIYILISILILSCNNEDANDCFQTTGKITQVKIELPNFEKLVIHERIETFISEGEQQKIIIESGENLLSDITAEVINNELIIKDNNSCNLVREYGITKVYITSPKLTVIRNASEYNISSIGTLKYPSLYLRSSGEKSEFLSVGDFHLSIKNENVRIWSNGVANFYLDGSTNNLNINFSTGDTRFEGENFIADHVKINQVSSNDILTFPVQSIEGAIYSTGDIILFNQPPVINVQSTENNGELIIK